MLRRAFRFATARSPRLSALLLGCAISAALLLSAEGALRAAGVGRLANERMAPAIPCRDATAKTGNWSLPNCAGDFRLVPNGREILRARVTTDSAGRRNMPGRVETAPEQVVFLGCSFTWGWGVGDEATLPARFQQARPDVTVWSLALSGLGPHDALVQIENGEYTLRGIDRRKPTRVVYISIPYHYARVMGDPYYIDQWGRPHPRFVLAPDGRLERRGTFEDARLRVFLARPLHRSRLLRVLLPLPRFESESTRRATMAALLGELDARIRATFPDGELTVVASPVSARGLVKEPSVLDAARAAGVPALDYSGIEFGDLVPGLDLHPDVATIGRLASALARDLEPRGLVREPVLR